MKEKKMSETRTIGSRSLHPDFPNEPIVGAVSGGQPKLTLRRGENGTYEVPRQSKEEIMRRFEAADDLVGQLVAYFKRKKVEFPDWTDEKNFERIRVAVIEKVRQGKWPYTQSEQNWILDRLREQSVGLNCGKTR
jgi:hypothetical protein